MMVATAVGGFRVNHRTVSLFERPLEEVWWLSWWDVIKLNRHILVGVGLCQRCLLDLCILRLVALVWLEFFVGIWFVLGSFSLVEDKKVGWEFLENL
jgi:hypothetical protein